MGRRQLKGKRSTEQNSEGLRACMVIIAGSTDQTKIEDNLADSQREKKSNDFSKLIRQTRSIFL